MKPLSRLESLIAEMLERPAWVLSSRKLHPLELTAALTKAMEARAVRLADRVLAPDEYEIHINPADMSGFGDLQSVLEQELADYLGRTIAERDISSNRSPAVRLVADASVRAGKSRVAAAFSAVLAPDGARLNRDTGVTRFAATAVNRAQPARRAATQGTRQRGERGPASPVLEIIGPDGALVRQFELGGSPVTIGRGRAAELALVDSKVSREHARIARDATGAFTVSDLMSLNGTLVNGVQIRGARRLNDGDLLEIGHFRLRFVANAAP